MFGPRANTSYACTVRTASEPKYTGTGITPAKSRYAREIVAAKPSHAVCRTRPSLANYSCATLPAAEAHHARAVPATTGSGYPGKISAAKALHPVTNRTLAGAFDPNLIALNIYADMMLVLWVKNPMGVSSPRASKKLSCDPII